MSQYRKRMIKIGKYAFKDESTSDAKITALGVDDEGNATHRKTCADIS